MKAKFLQAGDAVQSVLKGEKDSFPKSDKSSRNDEHSTTPNDLNQSLGKHNSNNAKKTSPSSVIKCIAIAIALVVIYIVLSRNDGGKSNTKETLRQKEEVTELNNSAKVVDMPPPTQNVIAKSQIDTDHVEVGEDKDIAPKAPSRPVSRPGSKEHAFEQLYSDLLNDSSNYNGWNIPTKILTEHNLSIGNASYKLYSGRANLRNNSIQGLLVYKKIDDAYEVVGKSVNVNLKDCYITNEEDSAVLVSNRNQKLVIGLLCTRSEKGPADQAKLVTVDQVTGVISTENISYYTGGPSNYKLRNFREIESNSNYWYVLQVYGGLWIEDNYYGENNTPNSGIKCRKITIPDQNRTDNECAKYGL